MNLSAYGNMCLYCNAKMSIDQAVNKDKVQLVDFTRGRLVKSIPEHLMKSMLPMATVALNQRDLKDISKSSLQMHPNGLDRYSLFQYQKV